MQHHALKNYHSFWKRKKPFTIPYKPAFITLLIWIISLSLITLGTYLNKQEWNKQQLALETTVNESITQYHQTSAGFIGVLDSSDMLSREGLAQYFTYLSASRHEGVWLSTITIDLQNSHLTIEGNALNTAFAKDFLDQLQNESSPYSAWKIIKASFDRSSDQYYHFSFEGQPSGS